MPICFYCQSHRFTLKYAGMVHPYKKDHGPFDIYRCDNCFSLVTYPMPDAAQQTYLYQNFQGGLIPSIRDIRNENPLTAWYRQCLKNAMAQSYLQTGQSEFTWIDLGAGGGELAKMMSETFPMARGWAIDFHSIPEKLRHIQNVQWLQLDLNDGGFANQLQELRADLVLSITVLEHVLDPYSFLKNALQLMKHPGTLYLTVPCAYSLASRMLGKKWPYLIPGEHLTVPSRKGMYLLLLQLQQQIKGLGSPYTRHTTLPYTLGYYLSFLKLAGLKRFLPSKIPVRLPTGMMEAGIKGE